MLRQCRVALALFPAFALGVEFLSGCGGNNAPPIPGSGSSGCVGPPGANVSCAAGGGPTPRPLGPQPVFGMTDTVGSPPPISGGTLLVTRDGNTAVASDPDRDAIYVVDLTARSLTFTIALQPGDEPGRLAEDGAGLVHVALRGGGALVTVDRATGAVLARRNVCPAPRGVAWDASTDLVWVACATGELVALPSAGGAAAQSVVVERDLRDVIVQPDGTLIVSKFRSAELLRVRSDGAVAARTPLPANAGSAAHVAWRIIAGPSAVTTLAVHQQEATRPILTNMPGGYSSGGVSPGSGGPPVVGSGPLVLPADGGPAFFPGGPPGPETIVESVVTVLGTDGSVLRSPALVPRAILPVDIALSPEGGMVAVASAGFGFVNSPGVWLVPIDASTGSRGLNAGQSPVVAVAFDRSGDVLAQTLEPAALLFIATSTGETVNSLLLSATSRHHTGSDIFHTQAGGLIACASCHPEGGDDGHLWLLDGLPRRTPSLRGTIAGTAPYHWPGEELDMSMLIGDVYTGRMSGAKLDPSQQQALKDWVESIPAPAAPSWVDANAARRGQALFQGSAGCATCHSGAKFTNNATVNVGTGRDPGREPDGGAPPTAFQVPPLVGVGWRTPLFHDGCAASVADRFGKCATPQHGSTAQLSSQDVGDLTAYLDTL
jgi:hypothetical protein